MNSNSSSPHLSQKRCAATNSSLETEKKGERDKSTLIISQTANSIENPITNAKIIDETDAKLSDRIPFIRYPALRMALNMKISSKELSDECFNFAKVNEYSNQKYHQYIKRLKKTVAGLDDTNPKKNELIKLITLETDHLVNSTRPFSSKELLVKLIKDLNLKTNDIQADYPAPVPADALKKKQTPLIEFYSGEKILDKIKNLDDILKKEETKETKEMRNKLIQWLFPTASPSPLNARSPQLTQEDISIFNSSAPFKMKQREAFEKMLSFFKLQEKSYRTNDYKIVPSCSYSETLPNWLNSGDPDQLRLIQILESLYLMGNEKEAVALHNALNHLGDPHNVPLETRNDWGKAVVRAIIKKNKLAPNTAKEGLELLNVPSLMPQEAPPIATPISFARPSDVQDTN